MINRSKNSISLRWNAPADNGAHIQHYVLERDEGLGPNSSFVTCYDGRSKSFNATKLQSATHYRFRLSAVST